MRLLKNACINIYLNFALDRVISYSPKSTLISILPSHPIDRRFLCAFNLDSQ